MRKSKDRAEAEAKAEAEASARATEQAVKEKAASEAEAEAVKIKGRPVIAPGDVPEKDFPTKGLFIPPKSSFTCGGVVLAGGTWINPDAAFLEKRGLNVEDLIKRGLLIKK